MHRENGHFAVARRAVLKAAGGVIVMGLAGCTGSDSAGQENDQSGHQEEEHKDDNHKAPDTVTIEMTDENTFDPERATVAKGGTVMWENVGTVGHTVTAYEDELPDGAEFFASGGFDTEEAARNGYPTGDIGQGETYEHTFETQGDHHYFCVPHESAGMKGRIEVVSHD